MQIKVVCASCGAALSAPSEMAGHKCKCPKCAAIMHIPVVAKAAPQSTAPAPAAKKAPGQSPAQRKPAPSQPAGQATPNIDLDDLSSDPLNDLLNAELGVASGGDVSRLEALASSGGAGLGGGGLARPLGRSSKKSGLAGIDSWMWIVGGGVVSLIIMLGILVIARLNHGNPAEVAENPAVAPVPTTPAPSSPAPSAPYAAAPATAPPPPAAPEAAPPPAALSPNSSQLIAEKRLEAAQRGELTPAEPVADPAAAPPTTLSPISVSTASLTIKVRDVVKKVQNGIVIISTFDTAGRELKQGCGFVIDTSGLVATNYNFVARAHKAQALFANGTSFEIVGLKAFDRARNLAIVELAGHPPKMDVLKLRLSENPAAGTEVVGISHSASNAHFNAMSGLILSVGVTKDLPSEVRGKVSGPQDHVWIQTTGPITGGNGGGPLLDADGQVLGVTNRILDVNGDSLAFVTHIDHLSTIQGQLRQTALPLAEVDAELGPATFLKKRDGRIQRLSEDFKFAYGAFRQGLARLRGASPEQLTQYISSKSPLPGYVQRLEGLAADSGKTPVAFQSLALICALSQFPEEYPAGAFQRAADQIVRDYPAEPDLGELLMLLTKSEVAEARPLMRRVLEVTPDPKVRGMACLALAMHLQADLAARAENTPEILSLLERVTKEFADVPYGGSTLGTMAEAQMQEMKSSAGGSSP